MQTRLKVIRVVHLSFKFFQHVLDLGQNNVEVEKINQDIFFTMIDKKEEFRRSSKKMNEELKKFLPSSNVENDGTKIVWDEDRMLTIKENAGKKRYNNNNTSFRGHVREILNFKAGFLEREMFLYYDEEFSKDSIFVSYIFQKIFNEIFRPVIYFNSFFA